MPSTSLRFMAWAAVLLVALYALLGWLLGLGTGLTVSLFTAGDSDATPIVRQVPADFDLRLLEVASGAEAPLALRWSGAWHIARTGLYDLFLDGGEGEIVWKIDGALAHRRGITDRDAVVRTVGLRAGYHRLEIQYSPDASLQGPLDVRWAAVGRPPRPLAALDVLVAVPKYPAGRAAVRTVQRALGWLLLAGALVVVIVGAARLAGYVYGRLARVGYAAAVDRGRRALAIASLVAIVAYGAVLRLDAVTSIYGPVARPAWLQGVQTHVIPRLRSLWPADLRWERGPRYPHRDGPPTLYRSDPYTYLLHARDMRRFYDAHYREPVFPLATKAWLSVLNDQDVAVSFASLTFSLFSVIGVYLLGALAFSRPVGLGAALAMAVEYDVVSWDVGGWRDAAFACAVVWCAYAMLRFARTSTRANAALVGLCAAFACLTRITALSFVLPAFACLPIVMGGRWAARLRSLGPAVLIMLVVVSPYLFNCWREYGDPLYAINVHADVYQAAENRRDAPPTGALAYVGGKLLRRPFQTIDTAALGLTSYPFLNKWHGFDRWVAGAGRWLSWAALAGLVLFAGSTSGRLLLLLVATSLVPFAFTWNLIADWRFTEHVYPFFLLAACLAIGRILRPPWAFRIGDWWRAPRPWRRMSWHATGLVVAVVTAGGIAWGLPLLTVAESLRAGEDVSIAAGLRDRLLLLHGWSELMVTGNVTARVSRGASTVVVPLPQVAEYSMTLRLDPFPRPLEDGPDRLPRVRLSMNGAALGTVALRWNAARVGAYDVRLPSSVVRAGPNTLRIEVLPVLAAPPEGGLVEPGIGDGAAVRLWHVRLHPPTPRS